MCIDSSLHSEVVIQRRIELICKGAIPKGILHHKFSHISPNGKGFSCLLFPIMLNNMYPAAVFIYSKGVSMNSKNSILLAIFAFSVIFNH